MAKILKVKKTNDGDLGVTCYGCEEVVAPIHSPALDFYDCPECGLPFEPIQLKAYRKAIDQIDEEEMGET